MQVRSNSPVRHAPAKPAAESAAPANVARSPSSSPPPGPAPTSPSAHSVKSEFGGQSPRTSSPPSRAPSPQEHAALNARTSSVGYGGSSKASSPASPTVPPWGVRPDIKDFALDVAKENPGTRLTHFTAQGNHHGTNGGVCNAMTGEWIKHGAQSSSMEQASAAFAHTLHHDMDGLIGKQAQFEGRMGELKNQQKLNKAEVEQNMKDLEELTPFLNAREAGKLKPKRALQVNQWEAELEGRMQATQQKISATDAKIAQVEKQEAANLGGGLSHTRTAEHKTITDNFAHDLDAATQKPGFYALHVHSNSGGPGHVMGIQVGEHGCKFMDPNTGEFVMKDRKAMLNVVTDHVGSMYVNRHDRFSVDHFN